MRFGIDDEQQSTVWENEYFAGDDEVLSIPIPSYQAYPLTYFRSLQFAQLLEANSITLRLVKESQEAGFLTSFCPITKFPAVVVIKYGDNMRLEAWGIVNSMADWLISIGMARFENTSYQKFQRKAFVIDLRPS